MTKTKSPRHPNHEITHLIYVQPKVARDRILEALRKEGMHKGNASKRLGCAHGTLLSWISQLVLDEAITKLEAKAEREGWHHGRNRLGGRAPMTAAERKSKEEERAKLPKKRRTKKAA